MRIIHVLKHAQRGNGSVHVAVDLACAQADAGHEVWFASARGSYDDLLRAHGVTVLTLTEPVGAVSAMRNAFELLMLTIRRKADIIHAHMMSSAITGAAVAAVTRARLVTTVHNSFDAHSRLMKLGGRVVAVSDAERELLISRGFAPKKVVAVLNGVGDSPREALPREDIGHLSTPAVMTLSGLHRRKAVDDVIRAFEMVADEFPEWHLNIVGDGPDMGLLREQAAESPASASIHFLGATLTPWDLLGEAEILASASLAEPCGLSVMEGRLAGCAPIVTAVGGLPQVVEYGAAGRLVPPRDPTSMAVALRELMGDRRALSDLQDAARRNRRLYEVDTMRRGYDAVYASLGVRAGERGET